MTDIAEVRSAAENLASAFEQFKENNDQRLAAIEKKGSADVILTEKVNRIDQQVVQLQDVVSGVKTAMRRPTTSLSSAASSIHDAEHKQAFMRYITKGIDSDLANIQSKAMSVLSDPNGGYIVPTELSDRIITRQFETTPMRQLATVMNITSEAVEMLRDTDQADANWVGEASTRSDTEQGQLARVRIPVHELAAQPKATQKLLDDASINAEDWLTNKVGDRFSRSENAAFVGGDGILQPRGFTTYDVAATSDASRAWGTLEYVATGANGDFAASTPADVLISLMMKLKAGYLPKAAWLMPRAVAEKIRRFKESTTNAYIWQPGLQAGAPATLLGYPVHLAEDMPSMGTGSLSLAFGNFSEGYTIVDRMGVRILRDPYTAAPFVKFLCSKRVGGDVTNFEAIKLLKFATA